MFATAKIISKTCFVSTLPKTSLVKKDCNFFVYIYRDKKFERTSITIGKEIDKNVEIIPPDSGFIKTNFFVDGVRYLESNWEKDIK